MGSGALAAAALLAHFDSACLSRQLTYFIVSGRHAHFLAMRRYSPRRRVLLGRFGPRSRPPASSHMDIGYSGRRRRDARQFRVAARRFWPVARCYQAAAQDCFILQPRPSAEVRRHAVRPPMRRMPHCSELFAVIVASPRPRAVSMARRAGPRAR